MKDKNSKKIAENKYIEGFSSLTTNAIKSIDSESIRKLFDYIWLAYETKKNIFFIGNGGSATTASHLASDIGKNTILDYKSSTEKRFRTMCLSDNISWITALGNDLGYDDVFIEQLKNFAQTGDLLVVISGSGNSYNIVKSVLWAKKNGLQTMGILGFDGGYVKEFLDFSLVVNSFNYGVVESVHAYIHHLLVELLRTRKKQETA